MYEHRNVQVSMSKGMTATLLLGEDLGVWAGRAKRARSPYTNASSKV
jgi:hypothetical protein